MSAPFEKRFAFHRSIVEFAVKLDAWGGVIALCHVLTSFTVFVRLIAGAVITVSILNTCGDSMIILMIYLLIWVEVGRGGILSNYYGLQEDSPAAVVT